MNAILKIAAFCACLTEGLALILVIIGTGVTSGITWRTWYGRVGEALLWPGIKVGDYVQEFIQFYTVMVLPI